MKKIVIAFEGTSFSEGAFEFARQLNDLHPILLTGVFIPQMSYANLAHATEVGEDDDLKTVERNKSRFENLCLQHNMHYKVHVDASDFALPELARETRFADLLLIGGETFYRSIYLGNPLEYLKEALHIAECPTVVIPEKFTFPKINLLAYDGGESSLFAIKQFMYLFPELTGQQTIIAYAADDEEDAIPARKRVEELMYPHFMDVRFITLGQPASKSFTNLVNELSGVFLVCGSFGRSAFSETIRKSFAEAFLTSLNVPVFIAHK